MKNWAISIVIAVLLAASSCAPHPHPTATPVRATAAPTSTAQVGTLRGRVVDLNGRPIIEAQAVAATGQAATDHDGWFTLPDVGQPQWVTVAHSGFFPRTRAVSSDAPVLFRLSPDDGHTILLKFAGDSMLGRRFFDPNEDGDPSDGLLPTTPTQADILKLLQPVQPLVANADLSILNLEGPLSDPAYFSVLDPRPSAYHSTKEYVFSSPTLLANALKQIGINGVDLGNNHIYDLLEPGVTASTSAIEQARLFHFGAGSNEANAWAPAIVTVRGQRIAFLGCTTVTRPIPVMSPNDISYVASDKLHKGGAAQCDAARLAAAVTTAKSRADVVVVMVHGGFEYDENPSVPVQDMTDAARTAGATLVVNGHPHVVGGFSWDQKSLVAWSMGNFIFDQTIWPTFQGYVLSVYLRDGKVVRAYADPVMIENYIPRGIAGDLADDVARKAAGLLPGPFVLENGAMEIAVDQTPAVRIQSVAMDGGSQAGTIVPVPDGEWISKFDGTGTLRLGQDLLWIGGFENLRVDGKSSQPPLWDLGSQGVQVGHDFAYAGQTGIRLTRGSQDQNEAVTSNIHRLLIAPGSQLTVIGMIRTSSVADIRIRMSWYPDTMGPSSTQEVERLLLTPDKGWQPFRLDLTAPPSAVAAQLYLGLAPPASGIATADFDNLRIIQWADASAPFSPLYDYAWLTGTGNVTFSQQVLAGGEPWFNLPK